MKRYTISEERRKIIESHFFEWSFEKGDDFIPSMDEFKLLNHPGELHYLASIYNWDDDHVVLRWILESHLCSRATANLIFWRSLPSYFNKADFNRPETCPSYCEAGFELIPVILQRYANSNFNKMNIAFDPSSEIEELDLACFAWTVPSGVYDHIQGLEIMLDD